MQRQRLKAQDERGANALTLFMMIVMIVAVFLALTFGQADGVTSLL